MITFEYSKYLGYPSASKTDENVDWVKEYGIVVADILGFIWVGFKHFERQSEHVLDCYQICVLPAE